MLLVNFLRKEVLILSYRIPNIQNKRLLDPHVVILGAGASLAACRVDKFGNEVPLLKNVHTILGLTDELKSYGFSKEKLENFEVLYSNIYGKPKYSDLQRKLEDKIIKYFQSLTLPDTPTLYDYLVLSLTEKDAIISFNWDPYLVQAYRRNRKVGNLPKIFFPHGNTGVGICLKCRNIGYAGCLCPCCSEEFTDMKLLFPVGEKNYYDKSIIENEWNNARNHLRRAAGLTIWGYNAPVSDTEAYKLMKEAFTESNVKEIAPFTIINRMNNKNDKIQKWSEIFDVKMLDYTDDFRQTKLWEAPRVSLESFFDARLQQNPRSNIKGFSDFASLEELQAFVMTITEFDMA